MSANAQPAPKKKSKQGLYLEKPNDDAMYCDTCEGWVDCYGGGDGNMRNHEKSKLHKENYEKKNPTPRRGPLDKFRLKKSAASSLHTPSAPPPLTNTTTMATHGSAQLAAHATDHPATSAHVSPDSLAGDATLALACIQELRTALLSLPADTRIAAPDDKLAVFARPSANPEYDEQCEYVGKTLHSVFDYKMADDDLRRLVCRGPFGLDGFCDWLEYFVRHHSLGHGVIAAKVSSLLSVISDQAVPATSDTIDLTIDAQSDMAIDAEPSCLPRDLSLPMAGASFSSISTAPCPGFRVPVLDGQSAHTAYPFALHFYLSLPWTYTAVAGDVVLHSSSCTRSSASFSPSTACDACAALGGNEILVNIVHRLQHGTAPHTAYEYLSHEQLVQLLRRKNSLLEELRFNLLSAGRTLSTLATANDRSQRIMRFIAEGKVQRAGTVLSNAFKRGYGLLGVMNLLSKAADGLYRAKSYTELEFRKAVVLLRFGGGRTSEFGYRALGLPSPRTVRRHMPSAVLEASPGMPTTVELSRNISTALDAATQPFTSSVRGYVLMLDEIAVEKRLRWDPSTNMILGTCREHNGSCSLEFRTEDEAKMLLRSIDNGKVHLASEATVLAIGPLAREPSLYEARPFGISGTCKREVASAQQILIQNALAALNSRRSDIGRCYCIASDGDAHRRLAMASLTMHSSLAESSPIYSQLACLPLMNLRCGKDDLTPDIDFKHIAKRMRNTLLRVAGTTVNGVTITRSVLKSHLVDGGLPDETADALLNPDDHQDVTLMYRLLAAIVNLPETPRNPDPFSNDVRRVLWLLGQGYYFLLSAYTNTALSLREQLEYLSATAHIFLQLYRMGRQRFVPSQLYIDLMIMIKNVYFCVAKTKVDDPEGSFWLMLLGTDRLEVDFGYSRTMVGNDSNCDVYQLSTRLLAIVQLALILAEHPEWDRGPRRLRLPPNVLSLPTHELDSTIDHLNPASWKGDVRVADVVLLTCWNHGRDLAEATLASADIVADFDEMCAGDGFDIFCPFGGNNSVLLDCGVDSVDDSITVDSAPSTAAPLPAAAPSSTAAVSTESESATDGDLEEDLTDQAADAAFENHEKSYSSTVLIGGAVCHKGRFLRLWSESHGQAGSTDRLDRIIGQSRFHSHRVESVPAVVDEPTLETDDPIATLLRCNGELFLALARVIGLRLSGKMASSVPLSALSEPGLKVTAQVLCLQPCSGEKDWMWAGKWEPRRPVQLDGRHVQVISPATDLVDGSLAYVFDTQELRLLTGELYGRLKNDTHHLAEVSVSSTYPYRTERGSACFVAQSEDPDADIERSRYRCSRCPASLLDETDMRLIREHMGSHILHDTHFTSLENVCGLCLRTGGACMILLKKGTAKGSFIIDLERSRCPNLFKRFSLKPAGESKDYSPCSNVPLICPACDPKKSPAAIWRYSLRRHLLDVHGFSERHIEQWRSMWDIGRDEMESMLEIYSRRLQKPKKKRKSKTKKRKLQLSSAHSSRLVARSTASAIPAQPAAIPNAPSLRDSRPASKKQRLADGSSRPTAPGTSIEDDADDVYSSAQSAESSDEAGSDSDEFSTRSDGESVYTDGEQPADLQEPALAPPPIQTSATSVSATPGTAQPTAAGTQPAGGQSGGMGPRRSVRSRTTKFALNSGGICFCDSPARGEEAQCARKGCETVLFHRSCVGLDSDEPAVRWKCPVCTKASR